MTNKLFFIVVLLCGVGAYFMITKKPAKKFDEGKSMKHFLFPEIKYPFTLPPLGYSYNALEPHIDEETMKIHHTKHHQTYIDNVNKALEAHPDLQKKSIEELLSNLDAVPESIRTAVRNHGGGHYNHSLFWQMLAPGGDNMPSGDLAAAIEASFGSYEKFKELFDNAAKATFGSGWAWLCVDGSGKLVVLSTSNQDTPLAKNLKPILGLDVWEHAYYLKYQNKRVEYIAAWWHVINWTKVAEFFEKAR